MVSDGRVCHNIWGRKAEGRGTCVSIFWHYVIKYWKDPYPVSVSRHHRGTSKLPAGKTRRTQERWQIEWTMRTSIFDRWTWRKECVRSLCEDNKPMGYFRQASSDHSRNTDPALSCLPWLKQLWIQRAILRGSAHLPLPALKRTQVYGFLDC